MGLWMCSPQPAVKFFVISMVFPENEKGASMYQERRNFYRSIGEKRSSRVIAYITGDRPGLEVGVRPEIVDFFVDHLDKIGSSKKSALFFIPVAAQH